MLYYPSRFTAPRQPHGRELVEDLAIACHEAGHAILRYLHGRKITTVTITKTEANDGRKINGRVRGPLGDLDGDQDWFSRLVEIVAGHAAEQVYMGESRGLRGSDEYKAIAAASALAETKRGQRLLIRAAVVEARSILRQHEYLLGVLTDALLARRDMTGAEVVAPIERHRMK